MSGTKVAIIGAGNVAWSLIPALQKAGVEVVQLISRKSDALRQFQAAYGIQQLEPSPEALSPHMDFVFLTVSDAAIAQVAERLPPTHAGILHCSGSASVDILRRPKHPRTGVFYPLQSFSKGVVADFSLLPIFLEAEAPLFAQLFELASSLSTSVYTLASEQREVLHMGAVWVNNFSNLMYQVADKLLEEEKALDFSVYMPLIYGHLEKLKALSPNEAQTGPAIRGDMPTLLRHLDLLDQQPALKELYRQLSRLINPNLSIP